MIFDSNTSRVTSCGSAGAGRAPAMGVSTGLIPWSSFVGAGRLRAQFGCQEWNACQSTQVIAVSPCLARNSGPARRLVLAGKNDAGNSIGHPPVEGLPGRGQRRPRPEAGGIAGFGTRGQRHRTGTRHTAPRRPATGQHRPLHAGSGQRALDPSPSGPSVVAALSRSTQTHPMPDSLDGLRRAGSSG